MTIEVGFVPEGSDVKVVVGEIALGCYGTFSDYSAGGNRTVISAFCRDDDSGGEVFAFDNEGFPEVGPWRVLPAEVHAEQNRVAVISRGDSYERDITTETRKKGRLILTHLTK